MKRSLFSRFGYRSSVRTFVAGPDGGRQLWRGALFAGALIVTVLASPARATMVINFNAGYYVVDDNGTGDSNPAVGTIQEGSFLSPMFGGSDPQDTIDISDSVEPSPLLICPGACLAIVAGSVDNSSPSASSVTTIMLNDVGYTQPKGLIQFQLYVSAIFGGSITGDSITAYGLSDPNDGQYPLPQDYPYGTEITLTPTYPNGAVTGVATWVMPTGSGPFSLGLYLAIGLNPEDSVALPAVVESVPEPNTIELFAAGAAVLAVKKLRKRRKTSSPLS